MIDFVVLWSDGDDPVWRAKYRQYYRELQKVDKAATGDHRYRDYGSLRYLFRSFDQYAPWVNKIYLVTDAQWPDWLTEAHPKVVRIDHSDIVETKAWLPTFSSRAIQAQLHNIPNLSERFVLFDDDMLLFNPVEETDFFVHGLPCYSVVFREKHPDSSHHFVRTIENCARHTFGKLPWRRRLLVGVNANFGWQQNYANMKAFIACRDNVSIAFHHFCRPYLKATFKELFDGLPVVRRTAAGRFRSGNDINHEIVKLWQICNGQFYGVPSGDGFYLGLNSDLGMMTAKLEALVKTKNKFACVNDNIHLGENVDEVFSLVRSSLEKKFPRPSSFEIDCT